MAAVPEFIPISKGKELFAMASWRDNGASRAPNKDSNGTANLPSSHNSNNNNNTNNNNNGSNSAAEEAAAKKNGESGKGGKRSNGSGGRSRRGRVNAKEAEQQPPDVEDYFVHILFPSEIPYKVVEFELFANSAPLKMIHVGPLKYLFQRRLRGEEKEKEKSAPPAASSAMTPPLHSSATPGVGEQDLEEGMPGAIPPAISLPPAELSHGENAPSGAAGRASKGAIPEDGPYRVSLLFAERAEAAELESYVVKRWPSATATVVPRIRGVLNTSLVLKCLPSLSKTEQLIEELQRLPQPLSYVRLLRSERGVFKNVLFAKYANCEAAEETKLRLERFVVGTRPLKVEFKKHWRPVRGAGEEEPAANGDGNGNGNGGRGPAEGPGATAAGLPQLVREIRVSQVHEGFAYPRELLTRAELKLLRQLCHSYGMLLRLTAERVTVRRPLGMGAAAAAISPAPRPAAAAAASTPSWAPVTPAPLRPMDFKGIRHWKEIRGQTNMLGIVRPLGPEDGAPAFPAGRGRPV